jgi:pimeloyl-ACP methyl ester carboxylesterase
MVGYGQSIPQGRGRAIGVRHQADYLLRWLRAVGVERAVMVGHDLGAGAAQIVAAYRPETCAGLVLTNAVCYDSWPIPAVRILRSIGSVSKRLPNGIVKIIFAQIVARGHEDKKRALESFREHWPNYDRQPAGSELLRQMRALDPRDTLEIAPLLPRLRIPARVVWGTADPFLKVHYGDRLANDLGTPLQRIEGGPHFTPEDHPGVIAGAINDVLREVGARSAA